MKVLVAVKRVIDPNVRIRVRRDHQAVETVNVKMTINPFCEIAVEEAVRLKEQNIADEVMTVTIGNDACQEVLRATLAMGADKALLIKHENELESLHVAKILAELVKKESPDLVLLGKQAIDSDNNQTGQMLAGLLGWSQGTFASKITISDNKAQVVREVDGGLETLDLNLPAIITTDLRLNEPRYISLPNIMQAKKKPLLVEAIDEFALDLTPRLQTITINEPPSRQAGIKVDNVAELVNKLKNEAKVI